MCRREAVNGYSSLAFVNLIVRLGIGSRTARPLALGPFTRDTFGATPTAKSAVGRGRPDSDCFSWSSQACPTYPVSGDTEERVRVGSTKAVVTWLPLALTISGGGSLRDPSRSLFPANELSSTAAALLGLRT
jgi:hypothetical protein